MDSQLPLLSAAEAEGEPLPRIRWQHEGVEHSARWHGPHAAAAFKDVVVVGDELKANAAYRLASKGTAMLWQGDYHNARQLLSALGRRAPQFKRRAGETPAASFYRYRQHRAQRSKLLSHLLVPIEPGPVVALRRCPDVTEAWPPVAGDTSELMVTPLQEVLGAIDAAQWRRNGVFVEALDDTVSPHYGVFAPVRNEYLGLVATAPLPSGTTAFDIGTGTGVLAAILAKRGMARVVATDSSPRAIECATDNVARLGFAHIVEPVLTDMFPPGRAALVMCNPPWLPGAANTLLDQAVHDPKSRMLKAFLAGLSEYLEPGGEGWLIISDLAEHLGLRSREHLLAWIDDAGLVVVDRLETPARHPRASRQDDPFFAERSAEITSLWRLAAA